MRAELISSEVICRLLVLEEIPGEEIGLEFFDLFVVWRHGRWSLEPLGGCDWGFRGQGEGI
jgi:hypothetical protein